MKQLVKRRDKYRLYFVFTFVAFAISFASLIAIPFVQMSDEHAKKIAIYMIALLFWLGLIIGIISTWFTNINLQRIRHKVYTSGMMERPKLPGVITITKKPVNIILYSFVIIGLVLMISDLISHWIPEFIMFPIISFTLYAFVIHSVIDGKNYKAYRIIKEGMHNENEK